MTLTHHLIRRGMEAASDAFMKNPDDGNDDKKIEVSPLAGAVISLTILFFILLMFGVS
jgi:hypothetical protein